MATGKSPKASDEFPHGSDEEVPLMNQEKTSDQLPTMSTQISQRYKSPVMHPLEATYLQRRRRVYLENAYAVETYPEVKLTPQYFLDNPLEHSRAMEWLEQELEAIVLHFDYMVVPLHRTISYTMTYARILSRTFSRVVSEFLGKELAGHFQHEFACFCASKLTLQAYDEAVSYNWRQVAPNTTWHVNCDGQMPLDAVDILIPVNCRQFNSSARCVPTRERSASPVSYGDFSEIVNDRESICVGGNGEPIPRGNDQKSIHRSNDGKPIYRCNDEDSILRGNVGESIQKDNDMKSILSGNNGEYVRLSSDLKSFQKGNSEGSILRGNREKSIRIGNDGEYIRRSNDESYAVMSSIQRVKVGESIQNDKNGKSFLGGNNGEYVRRSIDISIPRVVNGSFPKGNFEDYIRRGNGEKSTRKGNDGGSIRRGNDKKLVDEGKDGSSADNTVTTSRNNTAADISRIKAPSTYLRNMFSRCSFFNDVHVDNNATHAQTSSIETKKRIAKSSSGSFKSNGRRVDSDIASNVQQQHTSYPVQIRVNGRHDDGEIGNNNHLQSINIPVGIRNNGTRVDAENERNPRLERFNFPIRIINNDVRVDGDNGSNPRLERFNFPIRIRNNDVRVDGDNGRNPRLERFNFPIRIRNNDVLVDGDTGRNPRLERFRYPHLIRNNSTRLNEYIEYNPHLEPLNISVVTRNNGTRDYVDTELKPRLELFNLSVVNRNNGTRASVDIASNDAYPQRARYPIMVHNSQYQSNNVGNSREHNNLQQYVNPLCANANPDLNAGAHGNLHVFELNSSSNPQSDVIDISCDCRSNSETDPSVSHDHDMGRYVLGVDAFLNETYNDQEMRHDVMRNDAMHYDDMNDD